MQYINTGKCIWCGKTKSEGTTFNSIPHILPKSLGGIETCVDVCDNCNRYFGTATIRERLSCDTAVKEVLQSCRLFLHGKESQIKFSSTIFHIDKDAGKLKQKPNCTFSSNQITKQFKRGICEAVLQKYHNLTGKGNDERFDTIRKFARKGEGDIIFVYTLNKIVVSLQEPIPPSILMEEEDIRKIDEYGVFTLYLYGQILMIVMIPSMPIEKIKEYINDDNNSMYSNSISLKRAVLKDISELDPFYSRFHGFKLAIDEKENIIVPSLLRPSGQIK